MIRISLTEQDFTALVQGKVIKKDEGEEPVEICLQDIGYDRMSDICFNAELDFIFKKSKS